MSKTAWIFSVLCSKLWFSAAIYGVVAVVSALAALYLEAFIPEGWPSKMGAEAVDAILHILATSMLSVTIFSLSTMVTSYISATNNATPRATKLLIEDKVTHRALSTFLGTFIFSIVGIIALKAGVYSQNGRFILFIMTILLILLIIITLLRWVEYLTKLGRVNETAKAVELAAIDALKNRMAQPYLGGSPWGEPQKLPASCTPIPAGETGYIEHIDMACLHSFAKKNGCKIYIQALPGKFVSDTHNIAFTDQPCDQKMLNDIRTSFVIGDTRSFKQDPRFGLVVLNEIACRALSPAVNDPGTAIQAIGKAVRILLLWKDRRTYFDQTAAPDYPKIYVRPLALDDLFEDFFTPLARDGAAILEVQIRLQLAFDGFMRSGDGDLSRLAKTYQAITLDFALNALNMDYEKKQLRHYIKQLEQERRA